MHPAAASWYYITAAASWYYYASVGGATRHTVVRLCMCVSVCLSVGRISRRSLKTKR